MGAPSNDEWEEIISADREYSYFEPPGTTTGEEFGTTSEDLSYDDFGREEVVGN